MARMLTKPFWIRNATVITGKGRLAADVLVRGETIAEVVERTAPGDESHPPSDYDASALYLLPGGIDAHVHFGMALSPTLRSLGWRASSEIALLGGTTTIIDFANPEAGQSLADAVAKWRRAAADRCRCDYGLHATVIDTATTTLAELPELVAAGVPTFKGFLAYKGRLMLAPAQLEVLMTAVAACGGRLLVHAEDGELNASAEAALLARGRTGPEWHAAAHPPESEIAAVQAALAMARRTGCPLTLVHLSLARSLDLLRTARAAATSPEQLTGEVCLHHLFGSSGACCNDRDGYLRVTMSPPLREVSDSKALLAGLAAGDLDLLSTDHCEFSWADKERGAAVGLMAIPNGTGGVGERLVFSFGLAVAAGLLSVEGWVAAACERPAELMGLAGRKGQIAVGHDADLVLFDPAAEYRWQPLGASDRRASLYADRWVRGRVKEVWRRGQQVVTDGRLSNEPGCGSFIPRYLTQTHNPD